MKLKALGEERLGQHSLSTEQKLLRHLASQQPCRKRRHPELNPRSRLADPLRVPARDGGRARAQSRYKPALAMLHPVHAR